MHQNLGGDEETDEAGASCSLGLSYRISAFARSLVSSFDNCSRLFGFQDGLSALRKEPKDTSTFILST